jgi:AhpD family alkylhydroperoxidase
VNHNPYIDKAQPAVYRALNNTTKAAKEAYEAAGLTPDLVELVNVRVSQINGCPTCLSIHVPGARKAGVPQRVLDMLPSWRADTSGLFTDGQRAALALAEALTRPEPGTGRQTPADAVAAALTEFTAAQVSALEWAVVLINAYNRVSIGSGHPPLHVRG